MLFAFLLPNFSCLRQSQGLGARRVLGQQMYGAMRYRGADTAALDRKCLQHCPQWLLLSFHRYLGFSFLRIPSIAQSEMGAYPHSKCGLPSRETKLHLISSSCSHTT